MIIIHVKNDKSGLKFLNGVMKLFPDIKKENVVDALRQGYYMQFEEIL